MTGREHAGITAANLLRTALLAKLAVDLDDPTLARRAARHATTSARLLAGLDWQAPPRDDEDDDHLPEVGDLLDRMPSRAALNPTEETP